MALFENEVLEETEDNVLRVIGLPAPPTAPVARQEASKPGPKGRTKRTEKAMIASLGGSSVKEAVYVAERVRKLEDKISELLGSVSQQAREHILADYPHLVRY